MRATTVNAIMSGINTFFGMRLVRVPVVTTCGGRGLRGDMRISGLIAYFKLLLFDS
jgi:hypothetical protein